MRVCAHALAATRARPPPATAARLGGALRRTSAAARRRRRGEREASLFKKYHAQLTYFGSLQRFSMFFRSAIFFFLAIALTTLCAAAPTPAPTPTPNCGQYSGTSDAACRQTQGCWWCLKKYDSGNSGVCQPLTNGRTCANVAVTDYCSTGCLEFACGDSVFKKCSTSSPASVVPTPSMRVVAALGVVSAVVVLVA